MLRKQYAANKDEMAEALRRSVAENEVLRRMVRWLEGMIPFPGVDSAWFEQPKALNAKPEEPDAEPMELDSESE